MANTVGGGEGGWDESAGGRSYSEPERSNQQSGRKTRRDVLFSFRRRMEQATGMTNVEGGQVRKEVKTVALGPVAWRSLVALAAAFQPGYGMGARPEGAEHAVGGGESL